MAPVCRLIAAFAAIASAAAAAAAARPATKRSVPPWASAAPRASHGASSNAALHDHTDISGFERPRRMQTAGTSESVTANMTRLINDLLDGYDGQVPPMGATVRVQLAIQSIPLFDTQTQTLEVYGWWRQYWTDHRLAWDEEKYDGIGFVALKYNPEDFNSIWLPDINVYEAQSRFENFPDASVVSVYSDGSCFISRPIKNSFVCALEVSRFPFDTQACEFTVGSWSFNGDYFDVKPKLSGLDDEDNMYAAVDVAHYDSNPEYKLIKVQSSHIDYYYTCCPEPYPTISYRVWLERYPKSYVTSTILPLILVTFCGMFGLLMNPDSGERLGLAITTVLAQGVLYLTAVGFLPKVATNTFIQEVYMLSTAISIYVLVESVLVVSLYNVKSSENVLSEPALWSVFLEADDDNSGSLEKDELKRAIDQLGLHADTKAKVITLAGNHFGNGLAGAITFDEWVDVVEEVHVDDGLGQYHNFIVARLVRFFLPIERMRRKEVVMRRLAAFRSDYVSARGCLGGTKTKHPSVFFSFFFRSLLSLCLLRAAFPFAFYFVM
jgi:hypothetical protein